MASRDRQGRRLSIKHDRRRRRNLKANTERFQRGIVHGKRRPRYTFTNERINLRSDESPLRSPRTHPDNFRKWPVLPPAMLKKLKRQLAQRKRGYITFLGLDGTRYCILKGPHKVPILVSGAPCTLILAKPKKRSRRNP